VRNALIAAGAAVVVYFVWQKYASAAPKPGFGEPGFEAPATTQLPVQVVGCSFARAGGILVDANTGIQISEAEAQRRAAVEGCTVPPPPTKTKQSTMAPSIFNGGDKRGVL